MNYDVFTPTFPTLEGEKVRLREVREADIPVLFTLLQEPDVAREYCTEGGYTTQEQVRHVYLTCARANYQSRQQIQWLIEEKATGAIVGIRDLFVDSEAKPLTVQGFVGKAYRKRKFSKEAYAIILAYTKQHGAKGLMANTSVENYAAIALLYSVGFKPNYVAFAADDMRMVFKNDYTFDDNYTFPDANLKRLYIFCKMYLHATNINISEGLPIKYDNRLHNAYSVQLTAINTAGPSFQDQFAARLAFSSDGVIIMAEDDSVSGISFLDGRTAYLNSWGFCWNECRVG